ncbi:MULTISPECIES: ABC transporter ATP-binding protein [Eubacterium]|uniref:ABC transporter ATP-binding protein n=1 Tax=Eubacterium TaxID=1730 RepID=UPI000E52C55D|nr:MULTISPECIES: ABC transporter ATP-binding protein [Eubacterium]MBS5619376.1 ABC transporter ATP-binding protein [Eubacterium sp.]RGF50924.1 ABC transporter ATP-binding protein [Eubacterium sp. AF36-5BH]RHP21628.1 ABC transporter ATP-binding protein [Eubacterium sp. AF34-35BH]
MKENLKKMISYYKPYKRVFFADTFFAIIASIVALIIPLVVRYITSTVVHMNPQQAFKQILYIAIAVFVLIIIQIYCNYFISNYGHVMGAKIEYDMRAEIFAHFQKMPFSFFDDQKVGQLMSRITSDLFDITELLHHGPENVTISVIKIIGALCILLSIDKKLALAAFALVPFMIVYAYFFNKKMKQTFRINRKKIAAINEQIEDNLSGIRVVKSFANEQLENEKFEIGNKAFLEAKKNNYKYMGGYNAGLIGFNTMINLVVIVAGGIMFTKNMVNVTDFVTFLLYINIFTDPVKTLIDFTEQFQNGYSGYERFRQILDMEPEIKDKEGAKELTNVVGNIKFDDVSFRYNDNDHRVLKHINLEIPAGSYIALVGSSGAGKTTLCNLIPRFYDVTKGSISIDDEDIRNVKLKSLRNNIGMVQQDVYLFAGTIYENIKYGKPTATKEEVIAAAKEANAYDFIMSLPNGFDTDIGQRGIKLSGGQKQRLSIARVFLKNPPILIFDEATSALDNESEKVVQESMEKLAKNRTTLVIAHRLSTIRNAEKILVLTENGIEEQGTHNELINKKGIYYDLYNMTEV